MQFEPVLDFLLLTEPVPPILGLHCNLNVFRMFFLLTKPVPPILEAALQSEPVFNVQSMIFREQTNFLFGK
jgi:hypothetical protein